jgi:glutamyl-tRNA synthetase
VFSAEFAAPLLAQVTDAYRRCDWDAAALKSTMEAVMAPFDVKLGKAQAGTRVAVTGRTVGPPLFETLEVLGRDETLRRLEAALARLP